MHSPRRHLTHPRAAQGPGPTRVVAHLCFWLAFGCVGRGLLALAQTRESAWLGDEPLVTGLVIAALMLALAPVLAWVWIALERCEHAPSPLAKLSLALTILALSCFCLGMGVEWRRGLGPIGAGPLGLGMVGLALAGACSLHAWRPVAAALGQTLAWVATSSLAPSDPFALCVIVGQGCVIAAVGLAFCWRSQEGFDFGPSREWSDRAMASRLIVRACKLLASHKYPYPRQV